MRSFRTRLVAVVGAIAVASPALAAGLPTRVGQCATTNVKRVETRLADGSTNQPLPGSGSAIEFTNGGYQVSYEQLPAVDGSRPGDPIRICLVSLPKNCPPGDVRGKTYRATNLRTRRSWTLPDSEHMCGGA
jgi:hypothetical protein